MKTLRAKIVLPISSTPIEDGAVCLDGAQIVAVGPWREVQAGPTVDLGDVVLMPGLINAHCHLDYTGMKNAILSPGSFAQWVRRLNDLKRTQTDDDYLAAIAAGFAELRRWGTTSVFNIESFPELMVRLQPPPLRTWWFYEMLDIRGRLHTDPVVAGALEFFEAHPTWLGGFGLSPHAPYTTSLELYQLTRLCCEESGMPLMTHLAETAEEYEMFAKGTGTLFEFLASIGRDMSDTGKRTPVQHLLENQALPHGALLTHMNHLSENDWQILEIHREDFSIVHCPNCHVYFQRPPFDLERFLALGMNVCLGTDSLASNKALNIFEEMRAVRRSHPGLPAEMLLRMVTVNAAAAIGSKHFLGEIVPLAFADLIAIPYAGRKDDVYEGILNHQEPIEWLMVNGEMVDLPAPNRRGR